MSTFMFSFLAEKIPDVIRHLDCSKFMSSLVLYAYVMPMDFRFQW
jgi:hypothetical protein